VGRPNVSDETKAQVIELHSQGLSDGEIGSIIGKSHCSVYGYRKELGLPANPWKHKGGRPRAEDGNNGVHWSQALTQEQWEVVKSFFAALVVRKVYGRVLERGN
jgi:transposase